MSPLLDMDENILDQMQGHGKWFRKIVYLHSAVYLISLLLNSGHSYLAEPAGTLDIDSLSILLYVKLLIVSSVSFVQLTGTNTAKASIAIGTKIFKLQEILRIS